MVRDKVECEEVLEQWLPIPRWQGWQLHLVLSTDHALVKIAIRFASSWHDPKQPFVRVMLWDEAVSFPGEITVGGFTFRDRLLKAVHESSRRLFARVTARGVFEESNRRLNAFGLRLKKGQPIGDKRLLIADSEGEAMDGEFEVERLRA